MASAALVGDVKPESGALAERVEGWVQYCEYFHLLDADMQRTTEVSAELYRDFDPDFDVRPAESRVRATEHDKCFDGITATCLSRDRPFVQIEGGGSDGALILDDGSGTETGRRVLREADLAMVRTKLRAAAYSSNLRVAAEEQATGSRPEPPIAFDAMSLPRGKKSKACAASDPSTCAAAIETLLWFGLALGENSSRSSGDKGRTASVPLSELGSGALADFQIDCAQAMLEAGLTDADAADKTLAAVRALQERKGKADAPTARSHTPEGISRSESSSTAATAERTSTSDCGDASQADAAELEAFGSSSEPASLEGSPTRKTRHSVHSYRPPRVSPGASTPLLKLEKEQREKSAARAGSARKRRQGATPSYTPLSRQQLGDERCSDSASESDYSGGGQSTSTADMADCRLSDAGDDKPFLLQESPKRRNVCC